MRWLAIAVVLVVSTIAAQQSEPPRWRLKENQRFEFRLSGMVLVRGKKRIETRLWGRVIVEARKKNLLFLQQIDEMRWREGQVSYTAPKEELEKLRQAFEFSPDGRVVTEGPAKQAAQDLLTTLFPLPKSAKNGYVERVELPQIGVCGSLQVVGKRRCMGRDCLFLRLEATAAKGEKVTKEVLTEAYFDAKAGGFVRVERTIKTHSDKEKEEFLVLTVVGEPGHPSPEALAEAMLKELRRQVSRHPDDAKAWCKLSRLLLERGRAKEALKSALEGLREVKDGGLFAVASECAVASGDARLGLALAEAGLKVAPQERMVALAASRAAFYLQRYKEAAQFAAAALKDNKGPYQALYFLGASLAKLGKKEQARRVLREYIRKNPNLDPKRKWMIVFTPQNDVQILAERRFAGDLSKKRRYSMEELEAARQLLAVLVKEEAVRMRLTSDEIEKMLDYMAGIYGKKPLQMLSDFLADRVQAYNRLKRLLQKYERVPAERIDDFLKSHKDDADLCAAALSLLATKDILKRYRRLDNRFPGNVVVNLHILRLLLTNPGRYRKEAGKILGFLRNMEPGNGLYPLLFAWLEMEMENPEKVAIWVRRALRCTYIRTRIRESAQRRLQVLEDVGYHKGLRGVAAWTMLDRKLVRCVKEVMSGVVRVAEELLGRGDVRKAARWGSLAVDLGKWLGSKAEDGELCAASAAARERGAVVVEAAAMRAGICDVAVARKELEDAREKAQEMARAWWQLHLEKERAFTVWVITAPKKCWSFMERLFKMGERALLYERLKEQGGKR